jgi:hypothetical protein
MSIQVTVQSSHPVTFSGQELAGYHRPLGGESANLTVTIGPGALFAGWLEAPPLGAACIVTYDNETVLTGILAGVSASAEGVQLRVEG